jgi:uncharacterized protein YkwD/uncharacterized membrane protein required for colicin V production
MIVNIVIVIALLVAAYFGLGRGLALLSLELASFCLSTIIAFLAYGAIGTLLSRFAALPLPLSEVSAFVVIWIVCEILLGVLASRYLLPHIAKHPTSISSEIGGAILNALKWFLVIALLVMITPDLPIADGLKNAVTNAAIPRLLLADTSSLQSWLESGLGQDLSQSLNFLTVASDPEATERIELGYTTQGTPDPADEVTMLSLLNHERTSRGIRALTMNQKSRALARDYSEEMFANGYFSHIDPSGKNPFDRMKAAGISFTSAGENLALAPSLTLAEQGLMKSPGHRANILNPAYHTVGIGIINGGTYGLMITEDFTN